MTWEQGRWHDSRHMEFGMFVLFGLTSVLLFATGVIYLGVMWVVMSLAHLIVFEWKTNPDRYGWFGENPNLGGALMMIPLLFYWVFVVAYAVL